MDRVLFVDDEPNVLDGIRRQLRNRVEIETATSAAAGLSLIKAQGPFAVVVSTCVCRKWTVRDSSPR